MTDLAERRCVPCRGGVPPLDAEQRAALLAELGGGWKVVDGHHLEKRYDFPDFKTAFAFVGRVAEVAEEQGHHPDVELGWGRVVLSIHTHKIDGLTESDFVLAAKADRVAPPVSPQQGPR
jgi:4a-hydroxytetrahydrobiopterin dehydratase